jgi:hypothetical protein
MKYIILAIIPCGFPITIRLNPEDPNYLFNTAEEAQIKVDELQSQDTEGIQYKKSSI